MNAIESNPIVLIKNDDDAKKKHGPQYKSS